MYCSEIIASILSERISKIPNPGSDDVDYRNPVLSISLGRRAGHTTAGISVVREAVATGRKCLFVTATDELFKRLATEFSDIAQYVWVIPNRSLSVDVVDRLEPRSLVILDDFSYFRPSTSYNDTIRRLKSLRETKGIIEIHLG